MTRSAVVAAAGASTWVAPNNAAEVGGWRSLPSRAGGAARQRLSETQTGRDVSAPSGGSAEAAAPPDVTEGQGPAANSLGLAFELQLPGTRLEELRRAGRGALVEFMLWLQAGLAEAAGIREDRVSIHGIRGLYKRRDAGAEAQHEQEEVRVSLQLLASIPGEPTPSEALQAIRARLAAPAGDDRLSSSPFASALKYALLIEGEEVPLKEVSPRPPGRPAWERTVAAMLPVGITASIAGFIIWVTAI